MTRSGVKRRSLVEVRDNDVFRFVPAREYNAFRGRTDPRDEAMLEPGDVELPVFGGQFKTFKGRSAHLSVLPGLVDRDGRQIDDGVLWWSGAVEAPAGQVPATASFVAFRAKGGWYMSGTIELPDEGRIIEMSTAGGGKAVYQELVSSQVNHVDHAPAAGPNPEIGGTPGPSRAPRGVGSTAGSIIDIMIGMDELTNAGVATDSLLWASQIVLGVNQTNVAFANSNIPTRLRLIRLEEVVFASSSDNDTDLVRLTTMEGNADELISLRGLVNADLVGLVAHCDTNYGGIATNPPPATGNSSSFMWVMCNRNLGGATYSLAHETGHLLGSPDGVDPVSQGAFTYSKAWAVGGIGRTMMSGTADCVPACARMLVFSSPNVMLPGTANLAGDAIHDNARSIRTLTPIVDQYQSHVWNSYSTPMTTTSGADITGIGTDLFLIVARDSSNRLTSRTWNSNSQAFSAVTTVTGMISSAPRVSAHASGSARVVYRASDSTIRMRTYSTASGWSAETNLGGNTNTAPDIASSPAVANPDNDTIVYPMNDIIVVARDATFGIPTYRYFNGTTWGAWTAIGNTTTPGALVVTSRQSQRFEVAAWTAAQQIQRATVTPPSATSAWIALPALSAASQMAPAIVATDEYNLAVFAGTSNRTVQEADILWDQPAVPLVTPFAAITVAIGSSGTVGCGAASAMLNLPGTAPIISQPGLVVLACTNPSSGENQLRVYTRGY